jgi:hypothetical protein
MAKTNYAVLVNHHCNPQVLSFLRDLVRVRVLDPDGTASYHLSFPPAEANPKETIYYFLAEKVDPLAGSFVSIDIVQQEADTTCNALIAVGCVLAIVDMRQCKPLIGFV